MRVAVLGLGEAGSLFAGDIARAGADIHGFDPADVATPPGVHRHRDPVGAVIGSDLVLAVTAASDASMAMTQAWDHVPPTAIYADLATAAPRLKEEMAQKAAGKGVRFADVALMAPVPGRGLSTPALASGTGAYDLAASLNALGGRIDAIGDRAGKAAARKLLRSIVTKGLTALVIESMEAARATGDSEWLWEHLVDQLTTIDGGFLERMMGGTGRHLERRLVEMETVSEHLEDLGVGADMTRAIVTRFRHVQRHGLDGLPGAR